MRKKERITSIRDEKKTSLNLTNIKKMLMGVMDDPEPRYVMREMKWLNSLRDNLNRPILIK